MSGGDRSADARLASGDRQDYSNRPTGPGCEAASNRRPGRRARRRRADAVGRRVEYFLTDETSGRDYAALAFVPTSARGRRSVGRTACTRRRRRARRRPSPHSPTANRTTSRPSGVRRIRSGASSIRSRNAAPRRASSTAVNRGGVFIQKAFHRSRNGCKTGAVMEQVSSAGVISIRPVA